MADLKVEPRFGGGTLVFIFFIGVAVIAGGTWFLVSLLEHEGDGVEVSIVHTVTSGEDAVGTTRSQPDEPPPFVESVVDDETTDVERWVIEPGRVPVSQRAVMYALLLLGAVLLAAAATFAAATIPKKIESSDPELMKADVGPDVVKAVADALKDARPPNMLAIAGLVCVALAVVIAWNADPQTPALPTLEPVVRSLTTDPEATTSTAPPTTADTP